MDRRKATNFHLSTEEMASRSLRIMENAKRPSGTKSPRKCLPKKRLFTPDSLDEQIRKDPEVDVPNFPPHTRATPINVDFQGGPRQPSPCKEKTYVILTPFTEKQNAVNCTSLPPHQTLASTPMRIPISQPSCSASRSLFVSPAPHSRPASCDTTSFFPGTRPPTTSVRTAISQTSSSTLTSPISLTTSSLTSGSRPITSSHVTTATPQTTTQILGSDSGAHSSADTCFSSTFEHTTIPQTPSSSGILNTSCHTTVTPPTPASVSASSNRTRSISQPLLQHAQGDNLLTPNKYPQHASRNYLKALLSRSVTGLGILQHFGVNGFLTVSKQNTLTRLIIDDEVGADSWRTMSAQRFEHLAREICLEFPSETTSTYYVPYTKVDGRKAHARGKLYDRYRNIREQMRVNGVLQRRRMKQTSSASSEPVNSSSDLIWLKHHDKPWQEVKDKFKTTVFERVEDFKRSGGNICAYFEAYPALQHSEASELLEDDFSSKHPSSQVTFLSEWPKLERKVIFLATQICSLSKDTLNVLKSLNVNLDEKEPDGVSLNAFFCLIALLPSVPVLGKWKLSRFECKDGFILHAQNETDLNSKLEARRSRLAAYGECLPPVPVFVGPLAAGSFFVYANGTYFECPTLLKSVDLCFKIFLTLEVPFPVDCVLPWTFISKYVYGMESQLNRVIPAVENLGHRLLTLKLPNDN